MRTKCGTRRGGIALELGVWSGAPGPEGVKVPAVYGALARLNEGKPERLRRFSRQRPKAELDGPALKRASAQRRWMALATTSQQRGGRHVARTPRAVQAAAGSALQKLLA